MPESKTSATALVTMTVSVELSQPWGGECTLEQIQKQARDDAQERLQLLAASLKKSGINVCMEKIDKPLVLTSSIVVAPAEDIAGVWVGHCLDLDVVSQGSNPNEAFDAVLEAVVMAVTDDLDSGLNPHERPSAPAEDWEMFVGAMKHGHKVRMSEVKADSRNVEQLRSIRIVLNEERLP